MPLVPYARSTSARSLICFFMIYYIMNHLQYTFTQCFKRSYNKPMGEKKNGLLLFATIFLLVGTTLIILLNLESE